MKLCTADPKAEFVFAQIKRDGLADRVATTIEDTVSLDDLEATWSDIKENAFPMLPYSWRQWVREIYVDQQVRLKEFQI